MLSTQIQYFTLVETTRHNKETEKQAVKQLAETVRHNKSQEQYWFDSLAETVRHNMATEGETVRHNKVTEAQGWESINVQWYNAESNRMNALSNARNAETNEFSALTSYNLGLEANRIAAANAQTNARNAQTAIENAETAKFNAETARLNALLTNKNESAFVAQGYANVSINQQRADALTQQTKLQGAELLLEVEKYKTDTALRVDELQVKQDTLMEKSISDAWHNANDTLDTVSDTLVGFDRNKTYRERSKR